jgi:hypothetical protein
MPGDVGIYSAEHKRFQRFLDAKKQALLVNSHTYGDK